jgi:uncharacterized protein YndB with AHSA1/START domain
MASDSNDAVFKVHIRGTIEAVWHEITKTHEIQKCMFNCRMEANELGVGSKMRMVSGNGKYAAVVGEIIEWEPPTKYAHTFRFTNYDDPECIVRYHLVPANNGVDFTLTIENLPEGTKTAKQMVQGGTMIVNALKAIVETGKPPLGTRMLYVLFALTGPLTPKVCRVEHWPLS